MLYGLTPPQITDIGNATSLSQSTFESRFGLSPRTVEQWENGRRSPDRAAVTLLKVISYSPDVVEQALEMNPSAAALIKRAQTERPDREPFDSGPFARGWPVKW